MKKLIPLLAFVALLFNTPALAADKYSIDKSHTSILFFINHLGFSDMIGRFDDYDATLMLDEKAPENSHVDVVIRPTGINTPSTELNQHLQKAEWFNTEKFPEIRFVSTKVVKTGTNTADVTGDLTLLGVTKPITLNVRLNKADYFQMADAWIAGFSTEVTIKRSDFGMASYIPMVGDDVKILISTEFDNKEKKHPMPEGKKH